MTDNKFNNTRIEFHIIQSFPVSCLNRDDVGSPKSAIIGGTDRARVSSQCWKRAVRLALHDLGIHIGTRTKEIPAFVKDRFVQMFPEYASDEAKITACANAVCEYIYNKDVKGADSDDDSASGKNGKNDPKNTLLFLSPAEIDAMISVMKTYDFVVPKETGTKNKQSTSKSFVKEMEKAIKEASKYAEDGLDIALFGRMAASRPELNLEAAASFAHAISTHKTASEIDFFTAVDDIVKERNELGAGHMGILEFNSATYYRYVSLDLGQLAATFGSGATPENMKSAVDAFAKALFTAFPAARQTTMSAASPWDYALVTVRNGQRLQIPFNKAVKPAAGEDMPSASIRELKDRFAATEKMYGSLFGKRASFEVGPENGSIDDLIAGLNDVIASM